MASRSLRWLTRPLPQLSSKSSKIVRLTPLRTFATDSKKPLPEQDLQKAKDRAAVGVFDWRAAGLFIVTGVGLYFYFEHTKAKVLEERRKERQKLKYGKAFVGGPFELIDAKKKTPFTQQDLRGHWNLVYFGFTNCPDVCPEELDKMSVVVDRIEKDHGVKIQPIFISCDPARDTSDALEKYLADFHPRLVGLTGTYDQVKVACKSYRVYFSTPPDKKPGDDYLVDHSIFFYLMDPTGSFVEAFGKTSTADTVCSKFDEALAEWNQKPLDQRT